MNPEQSKTGAGAHEGEEPFSGSAVPKVSARERARLRLDADTQALVAHAKNELNKFNQSWDELLPVALEKITQVIQPKITQLVERGALLTHDSRELLPESIPYRSAKDLEDVLNKEGEVSEQLARRTVQRLFRIWRENFDDPLEVLLDTAIETDERWYGVPMLAANQRSGDAELVIKRFPGRGMGFGFAMAQRDYYIHIPAEKIRMYAEKIHPGFWVEFAKRLEEGQVTRWVKR